MLSVFGMKKEFQFVVSDFRISKDIIQILSTQVIPQAN